MKRCESGCRITGLIFMMMFFYLSLESKTVIQIPPCNDPSNNDATALLKEAILQAKNLENDTVVIQLSPAIYNFSREFSTPMKYHISNTTSLSENPENIKHIAILLKDINNLTIDGGGAILTTHGEITTFVIDNCKNIRLKNFTVAWAEPSVVELSIKDIDQNEATFQMTPPSKYKINDGLLKFVANDREINPLAGIKDNPLAVQVFYPDSNLSQRCVSPFSKIIELNPLDESSFQVIYSSLPRINKGEIYTFRHSIRNEVGGFVNESENIVFNNIEFNFMGNFGIVNQFSTNLTYDNVRFCPPINSPRVTAGFADFLQFSGCNGKILIENSIFRGPQDDHINIHGTYLQAVDVIKPNKIIFRYMHPQTYGFAPAFPGDTIEFVNKKNLLPLGENIVKDISKINDYDYQLTFLNEFPSDFDFSDISDIVMENITRTPIVEIRNNLFSYTPTRGILLTSRRKSIIEKNVFENIPLSSILISGDAANWYESGPVEDLTIRKNIFINCQSPQIKIEGVSSDFSVEENIQIDTPYHKGIKIESNIIEKSRDRDSNPGPFRYE